MAGFEPFEDYLHQLRLRLDEQSVSVEIYSEFIALEAELDLYAGRH